MLALCRMIFQGHSSTPLNLDWIYDHLYPIECSGRDYTQFQFQARAQRGHSRFSVILLNSYLHEQSWDTPLKKERAGKIDMDPAVDITLTHTPHDDWPADYKDMSQPSQDYVRIRLNPVQHHHRDPQVYELNK